MFCNTNFDNPFFISKKSLNHFIVLSTYSQATKQDKSIGASMVYGFFLGMESTLENLYEYDEDLRIEINRLNLLKTTNFGLSKKNALAYLKSIGVYEDWINDKRFDSIKRDWRFKAFVSTDEEKRTTLKEIENYLKGNIPPPMLENVLAFQYMNQPHKEFVNGFTFTFNTKGHKKSKNTEVILTLPKSWIAQEGKQPNVIQHFISDCGNGHNSLNILTQELPINVDELSDLTLEEINDLFEEEVFTEEFAKEMTDGSKLISFKPMKIANRSGCLVTYETIAERMGIKFKMRTYSFIFHDITHLHFINCGISTSDIDENLDKKGSEISPLFFMIVNSVVVPSKNQDVIYLNGNSYVKTIDIEIGRKKYEFLLDTGATITSINQNIFDELYQKGVLKIDDFIRKDYVELASGQKILVEFWAIPELKIGSKTVTNIVVGVQKNNTAQPLLGMNILNKLDSWKIDLDNNKIYLR